VAELRRRKALYAPANLTAGFSDYEVPVHEHPTYVTFDLGALADDFPEVSRQVLHAIGRQATSWASSIHGFEHWIRVAKTGRKLAAETPGEGRSGTDACARGQCSKPTTGASL
jgi:hypothetical protein